MCVQTAVALPLLYVIACTYAALFAVDIGSLYMLLPYSSSSFSLLFNGNLMARFAPSLCYNYLHVLSMDRPTKKGFSTVFAQRMGLTNDATVAIPFLGMPFNRWAPVIMIVVVALTFFHAFGARLWPRFFKAVWRLLRITLCVSGCGVLGAHAWFLL